MNLALRRGIWTGVRDEAVVKLYIGDRDGQETRQVNNVFKLDGQAPEYV